MLSKDELMKAADLNHDGTLNYKDFLMLAAIMGLGYFVVKTGLKYFKKG